MSKSLRVAALASAVSGLVLLTAMHAQNPAASQKPGQDQKDQSVAIADPVEYQAYQNAVSPADPAARAAAIESFLKTYPKTVAAKTAFDSLEDAYQAMSDRALAAARAAKTADAQAKGVSESADAAAKELDAANRLLTIDSDNLKALLISVAIMKSQATKTDPSDAKAIAAAAEQARRGLKVTKPQGTSDEDWQRLTGLAYPIFHSAIGLDAEVSKHFDVAADEFKTELRLYPQQATTAGTGLVDTLHLADAYAQADSKSTENQLNAIWFYARALDYAPEAYKSKIELQLRYWYNRYHGGLDGLDDVKKLAAASVFPGADFAVMPAPTWAERIELILKTTDVDKLSLGDKETILAHAFKGDAERVWASLKDQPTPVPGTLIAADASAIKVTVTERGATPNIRKTTSYLVKLTTPMTCQDASAVDGGVKGQLDFILNNGFKEDTDPLAKLFSENPGRIQKIVLDPTVATVKVAVTEDAKQAKSPDFIVNLKDPVPCKALPAAGAEFGKQPAIELDGTYDSYMQVAAAGSSDQADQSVRIVLRDGFLQAEKKKTAVHKPVTLAPKASHT